MSVFLAHVPTSDVSIHAPVKGAIEQEIAPGIIVGSFNPRAHEGCASVLRHLLYS